MVMGRGRCRSRVKGRGRGSTNCRGRVGIVLGVVVGLRVVLVLGGEALPGPEP